MAKLDKNTSHLLEEAKKVMAGADDDAKASLLKAMQQAGQQWLPDDKFHEQFDRGVEMAKERGDDELLMEFWLYGTVFTSKKDKVEDKEVCMPVILADWDPTKFDKELILKGIGMKFAEQFPDHMLTTVVHIAEGWGVQRPNDAPAEDWHIAPSKSPNRVEIAFVTATSMDRRQAWWQAEIVKNDDGSLKELKEMFNEKHKTGKPSVLEGTTDKLSMLILQGNGMVKEKQLDEEDN